MSDAAVVALTKRCRICGVVKNVSHFYRQAANVDGLYSYCRPCSNAATKVRIARDRKRMGDERWLAQQRERVRQSRARTGDVTGKLSKRAYSAASARLRDAHRAEFELLLRSERYERGLSI